MSWTLEKLQSEIKNRDKVIIELGCGPNPDPEVIGLDLLPLEGVNYVTNVENGLNMIPSDSVDEVRSRHFLEHIENFEFLMREVFRVLKPGGKHFVVVPHHANPYYYSDYTHRRFFGLYSFDYLGDGNSGLRRKVPAFYNDLKFSVTRRKIVFKSPEFPVRNLFKRKILQPVFNLNSYMQELYEGSFCYTFPPQEIEFEMITKK